MMTSTENRYLTAKVLELQKEITRQSKLIDELRDIVRDREAILRHIDSYLDHLEQIIKHNLRPENY